MKTRIVYLEYRGDGITGPARTGRVSYSKTGKTIYYKGQPFASLLGGFVGKILMSDSGKLSCFIISLLAGLLFISFPAGTTSAGEAFVESVDPTVEHVLSGGLWEDKDSYGRYRVVVQNLGWEHTRSYLYLQWLETHDDTETITELMSIPVSEFNEGGWRNVQRIDRDGNVFVLHYTARGNEDIRKALLRPGKPGKYAITLETGR